VTHLLKCVACIFFTAGAPKILCASQKHVQAVKEVWTRILRVYTSYVEYVEAMVDLNASMNSVYWCMFHKPPPDELGGCKLDDITWGKRKREYDVMTREQASTALSKIREIPAEFGIFSAGCPRSSRPE
jgi:hypothetical protein